jgi:integrase
MEWSYVDLDRGLLLLPDSKTGRKTIVLNSAAVEQLRNAPKTSRFVVPGLFDDAKRTDLKRPWATIMKYAGLEGIRLHDLRHTFASVGAGSNLGLPIIGKLLGHRSTVTTARYAHLDVDPLRRGTETIGNELQVALSGHRPQGQSDFPS